jgi:hypothetical protein
MRLRLAALVLATATCGLFAPARAEEQKLDLTKYMPDGAGMYVHINVQQLLASPVVRKAIPMAVDKYSELIMNIAQMAKAFDPNAANVPNEQIKSVVDELKKPATIATAFDTAKDGVTDIIVTGDPDKDDMMLIVKCHEAVTPDLVKGLAQFPAIANNPQLQIKTTVKDGKTVFELIVQGQSFYLALPEAGVVLGSSSKALVEKGLAGKGTGLKPELKKLVDTRAKTDFIFSAVVRKGTDESGILAGWLRLVLDENISGEISANYANAAKAADQAKEMNDHIGEIADKVKEAMGPAGKDIAAALTQAKAVASGTAVTSKFKLSGSVIEKLLAKD